MEAVAQFVTSPESMIILLASLGTFVTILAIGAQVFQKDDFGARVKAVQERRQELSNQRLEELAGKRRNRPSKRVDFMRAVLDRLKLQNLIASKEVRKRLAQGGYRGQSAAVTFGFARLAIPVVLVVGAFVFMSTAKNLEFSFMAKSFVLFGLAAVGYFLPNVMVANSIAKRQQIVTRSFPDALDLLTICVEAGLSIEGAFSRVSEEMAESAPEMAEEFGLTTAELAFLGSRTLAFQNMAERTGLDTVKSLTTALIQSEKYGTPVSTSLRVLSQDNRDYRMSLAEKKAGALPAQLTVPMIVFFLPVLFVVILGPAVIQVMKF